MCLKNSQYEMEETCFQNLHNAKLDLGYENTMGVFGAMFLGQEFYIWSASSVSEIEVMW